MVDTRSGQLDRDIGFNGFLFFEKGHSVQWLNDYLVIYIEKYIVQQ